MLFGTPSQTKSYSHIKVYHREQQLEQCNIFKYLGIVLDSHLNFSAHVEHMKSKTIGKIRLLGRVRNIIDRDTAELLYKTLILPIYDYCDYIYYPLGVNSIDTLQKLQNTALRVIVKAEPRVSIDRLHTDAQMPRLAQCRQLHVAEQMHKFVYKNCPITCSDLFLPLNENRIRPTRSEAQDLLAVPRCRLVITECNIRYYGVVIWNSIPDEIRRISNHSEFKLRLRQYWQMG